MYDVPKYDTDISGDITQRYHPDIKMSFQSSVFFLFNRQILGPN